MDKLGQDQMASNLHRRHDVMVQYNVNFCANQL